MRKYALIVAASAGLACGVSSVKADWTITSVRTAWTATGAPAGFDQVVFRVQNTGTGAEAGTTGLLGFDAALYAPTSIATDSIHDFSGNGLVIATNDDGLGNPTNTYDPTGNATLAPKATRVNVAGMSKVGDSVLSLTGTVDSGATGSYTEFQKVAGVGVSEFSSPAVTDTTAQIFAVAIVPTGDPVELLAPTSTGGGNRSVFTSFEPGASRFGNETANPSTPAAGAQPFGGVEYIDPGNAIIVAPEPTSLGLLGIGLAGLLGRRRRSA